ncbi:MAG: hypothetical protein QNK05_19695 [Myxococcota bacterium]|nr:hypothetical protein [Myxococcota bacterium]
MTRIIASLAFSVLLAAPALATKPSFYEDPSQAPEVRLPNEPVEAVGDRHPYGFWRDLERTQRSTAVNALERHRKPPSQEKTPRVEGG